MGPTTRAARIFTVLVAMLAGLVAAHPGAAAPERTEIRRILIFNDLGVLSSPGVARMDRAIYTGLEKSRFRIELYAESLETTLFSDAASQRELREGYLRKYRNRKPDLILTVGPSSLRFLAETHQRAFAGTPIIFCGAAEEMIHQLTLDSQFTGVWGVPEPAKTLEAALRLQPGTRHVFVVGGTADYDRELEAIAKGQLRKYESQLEFTYLTDLEMPALLERLKHLPPYSIVYHTSVSRDGAGDKFIDATQSVPLAASNANAPVFLVDDVDLGSGGVGGDLLSFTAQGEAAAEMALRVLNGEKPRDIPILKLPSKYMFDWRALRRWGLDESRLPPGSVVLERRLSIWEAYQRYILAGILLIAAQALLIVMLLWQRAKMKKAEEAGAYSERRFAEFFSTMPEYCYLTSPEGVILDANPAALEALGYTYDEIRGLPLSVLYAPESAARRAELFEQWKTTGTIHNEELTILTKQGQRRTVLLSAGTVRDGQGNLLHSASVQVDITERKQIQEQLRESQSRLQGIVASAMDAIIAIDDQQRILVFNAAAEKMFGCSAQEAIGSSIGRFIPERSRTVHSGYIRHFGEIGVSPLAMRSAGTVWALDAKGNQFPIEASISLEGTGEKRLYTAIVRDITQRKRAEEALRESEERFRLVANTAPVMIWMSGTDALCDYFNQRWLEFTGRTLDAELGNGWTEGVHPEDLDQCLETYTTSFQRREPFEMDYRLRRHDGEYRWIRDHGVPRFNVDDTFAGFIGSCHDITEHRRAQEALSGVSRKLIEAHEEERTWLARELHDGINQRIAMLAVTLEGLSGALSQSPPQTKVQAREAYELSSQLGSDVQALSHHLHSSKLEYLGLTAAADGFCKEFAERNRVEVEFQSQNVPRKLPEEISLCLFRVLQEALRNAAKHSGAKRFLVSLDGEANGVQLAVRDWGIGFVPEAAIFGTGLGLISMKERVKLVGGEFYLDSRPGSGTLVRAMVPLKVGAKSAQASC